MRLFAEAPDTPLIPPSHRSRSGKHMCQQTLPVLRGVFLLAGMARSWPRPFAQGEPTCRRPSPWAPSDSTRGPAQSSPLHLLPLLHPTCSHTNAPSVRERSLPEAALFTAFLERLTSSHLLRAGEGCAPSNSVCRTSLTQAYLYAVMVGEGEIQNTSLTQCCWG